nr:SH3 domain-containing protein [Streptomyces sp. 150FB]
MPESPAPRQFRSPGVDMPLRSLALGAAALAATSFIATTSFTTSREPAPASAPAPAPAPGTPGSPAPGAPATTPIAAAAHAHDYTGRVIAKSGLLLRDKPTRGSRIIGSAAYGSIVHIFCKTQGDTVNGNDRWYLLTDGTWAWGSAAYISNIGAAPRWC